MGTGETADMQRHRRKLRTVEDSIAKSDKKNNAIYNPNVYQNNNQKQK